MHPVTHLVDLYLKKGRVEGGVVVLVDLLGSGGPSVMNGPRGLVGGVLNGLHRGWLWLIG